MGIDLKPYFESHLPYYKIQNESYVHYHPDDSEILRGSTLQSLAEICSSYKEVIENVLIPNEKLDE